jgi:hypothetical protein
LRPASRSRPAPRRKPDDNRDGRLDAGEFVKADAIYLRERTGAYAADSVLTAKVRTALLRERGLKSMGVNVETYRGRGGPPTTPLV